MTCGEKACDFKGGSKHKCVYTLYTHIYKAIDNNSFVRFDEFVVVVSARALIVSEWCAFSVLTPPLTSYIHTHTHTFIPFRAYM